MTGRAARRGTPRGRPPSRLSSDDVLKVDTGSWCPALYHVEKRGWLKAEWDVSEAHQRAQYYRLTAAGQAQLAREQDRWQPLVRAIGGARAS